MTEDEHGTIFLEDARVLSHTSLPGNHYCLRLKATSIAARAHPGSFVHIRCDESLPMRRPMSIMGADAQASWIEVLYRVVGKGTHLLSRKAPAEMISLLGPIGKPFAFSDDVKRPLLIGGGVGIPPLIFLADRLRVRRGSHYPLFLAGSERPYPFPTQPSRIVVPGMPAGVIAGLAMLEEWGVPSRLATQQGFAGCFDGYVTDLAQLVLSGLQGEQREEVTIFACGPLPMLRRVTGLAQEWGVPCQVSLEEYMACAVGGCAGCVVAIETAAGPSMKRVCVDGPVFNGEQIIWP